MYYAAFQLRFDFNPKGPAQVWFWKTVAVVLMVKHYKPVGFLYDNRSRKGIKIHWPSEAILFDRSENDLFKLGMGLSAQLPEFNYVHMVGDIVDVGLLREVFALYRPHTVFHAAAD